MVYNFYILYVYIYCTYVASKSNSLQYRDKMYIQLKKYSTKVPCIMTIPHLGITTLLPSTVEWIYRKHMKLSTPLTTRSSKS